jgi:2-alkyl-3-oxoalkanoate reductase
MMTRIRGTSNAKARRELGWEPLYRSYRDGFRRGLGNGAQATSTSGELAS